MVLYTATVTTEKLTRVRRAIALRFRKLLVAGKPLTNRPSLRKDDRQAVCVPCREPATLEVSPSTWPFQRATITVVGECVLSS